MSDTTTTTTWPLYPSDYPRDEASREAIRLDLIERANIKAFQMAMRQGRSMRCAQGDHGCRNEGTTCLCRCHDRRS